MTYKLDNQDICKHSFLDLNGKITEDNCTWFFCMYCLLLVKKELKDQSEKL